MNEIHPTPKYGIKSNNSKIHFNETKLSKIKISNEFYTNHSGSYAADKNSFFRFKNSTLDQIYLFQLDYKTPDYSVVQIFDNSLIKNSRINASLPSYFGKSSVQNTKVNAYADHGYEIRFVDCTLSSSNFHDGSSAGHKGGIIFFKGVNFKKNAYLNQYHSEIKISNCLFEDNNITSISGGANWAKSGSPQPMLYIVNSVFSNNLGTH